MAFEEQMQGQTSHDGVLRSFDEEVRVLEGIRKFVNQRIKCDRDYASAMATIINEALKKEAPSFQSQLFTTWVEILHKMATINDLVSKSTDRMSLQLDKVMQLITDKKLMKRYFAEERARLDTELEQLKEDVKQQESEYEKSVQKTMQDFQKYNEAKVRGRGKMEEPRVRYIKSAAKLHRVHNEYLTTIREVNLQQQHYSRHFLPQLLQYEEYTLQTEASLVKTFLQEFCMQCDTSAASFSEVFSQMRSLPDAIEPQTVGADIAEKYRSPGIEQQEFTFNQQLLRGYQGRLVPDELAVDTLSAEALHQRIELVDIKRMEIHQSFVSKQEDLNSKLSRSVPVQDIYYAQYLAEKEIRELQCQLTEAELNERKYTALAEFLQTPTDKLASGGSIPYGVDAEQEVSQTNGHQNEFVLATGNMRDRFRQMFSKLRHRQPPTVETNANLYPVSSSNGDDAPPFVPRRQPSQSQQAASSPLPPTPEGIDMTAGQVVLDCALEDEPWFHRKCVSRDEANRLLVVQGDFLVRESKGQYVLSMIWNEEKRHFIIAKVDGGWRLDQRTLPTIQELLYHHFNSGEPVSQKFGAMMLMPIMSETWKLDSDKIILGDKLGKGNFGDVCKGYLKMGGIQLEVAVKTCHDTLPDEQKSKFLEEATIMKSYNHPNIVRCIGVCSQSAQEMIVMEYLPGGALHIYVKKYGKQLTVHSLLVMALNIASGMKYLANRNCIHRDLAARNCLLSRDNVVKISDFGLSRQVEDEYTMSSGAKQIPIKWTAPEALNYNTYTTSSDVWSYGIVLWELFSPGLTPYPSMTNNSAKTKINQGYRMSKPDQMPEDVDTLMRSCWEMEPKSRPSFDLIHATLEQIIRSFDN